MPDIQAQTPDGVTHSFPDGTPDEIVDKVIKNHVQNMMPYTEKGAAAAPPRPNLVSGSPLGNAITRREAEEPSDQAIGRATGVIGAVAPAVLDPMATAGAVAGGVTGAYGGGKVGRYVGGETGEKIGKVGGGLVGSILGGGAVNSFEGLPEETTIAGMKFRTPSILRKSPFEPSEGYSNPLGPDKGEFETQHEAQLTKEGKLAKIPARMPKQPPTPEEIAQRGMDVNKAKSTTVHGRPYEKLNEQEQAEALMRRGREQQQIDEGAPVGGSNQKVLTVPEPNPVPPGENPNNQQSVPRRTTLVQNAKRAKEGAGTQLNQIHGPVLYEPKGTGYSGVREQVPLDEQGNAIPPVRGGSTGTISGTEPIVPHTPAKRGLTTDNAPVEDIHAPAKQWQADIEKAHSIKLDPSASAADKKWAQDTLDQLRGRQ